MRTTVWPDAHDPDETDEWPGCFGTVDDDGTMTIVDHASAGVEQIYRPGTWASYQVTSD